MGEKQRLLGERLAVAVEIAAETGKRVGRLTSEWRRRAAVEGRAGSGSAVSSAESEWRVEVEWREEQARKEEQRVDEVAVRVAQLAALRERIRAVQASEQRHSGGGGWQLGSVETGRLQAELSGQTRSIEELMADVRDVRRQVRKRAEIDTWEGETAAERTYSDSDSRLTAHHLLQS